MTDVTQLPAYVQLRYAENGVIDRMRSDIRGVTQDAKRQFDDAFTEIGRQVDRALSVERNSSGSLDLQAEKLRELANNQQARATAAEEVARATRQAAQAEGDYSQQARLVLAATEAMAREERDAASAALARAAAAEQVQIQLNRQASATQAVVLATNRGTEANRLAATSSRALRQASTQAGQQLQDIGIMLYSGQRAAVTFAQQLPQLAFALTALEGSANKAHQRIGRFATFLAGPWGLAVGVAVGAIVTLTAELLNNEDKADDVAKAHQTLADQLDFTKRAYEEVTKAAKEYNEETERAGKTTLQMAETDAIAAREAYDHAIAIREKIAARLQEIASDPNAFRRMGDRARVGFDLLMETGVTSTNQLKIDELRQASQNANFNLAMEQAKLESEAVYEITESFKAKRDEIRQSTMSIEEQRAALLRLNQAEKKQIEITRERERADGGGDGARRTRSQVLQDFISELEQRGQRVISSQRSAAKQNSLYRQGLTPLDGYNRLSRHQSAQAVDLDKGVFDEIAVREAAQAAGLRGLEIITESGGRKHAEWSGAGGRGEADVSGSERAAERARKAAEAAAREQERIATFMDRAAEGVQRINERFDEQPRLVDQAEQAGRRLNQTIADTRAEMEKLAADDPRRAAMQQIIDDAEAAKGTIADALVRPFEQLREESENRLAIDSLIAQGRDDEAAALQEILRLEETIGDLSEQQKADILDIVRYERERSRELARQRGLLDQQVAVLDTAREGLLDILSGRSTDLLGDLKQSINDLQGARLFDDLFGSVFQELESELSTNTPVGRANQALAGQVDQTTAQAERLGQAFDRLAGVVERAGGQPSHEFGAVAPGSSFGAAFAPFAAANDNGIIATATGHKTTELGRRSIDEVADKIAEGIVNPLLAGLDETLGTKFAAQLSGVLSGALSGYIRGGKPGAVLGGLEGLNKQFGADIFGEALSGKIAEGLGTALGGAQQGSQIAAITGALGLPTSSTGAAIGGALGSVFGPIGSLVGSLGGNFLGALFGGPQKGSAIIGGTGGELGIRSFRGNSGDRRDAAGGLGKSVIDAVNQIAEQLNAKVDASRGAVSIGLRGDEYRVDPQGRGVTNMGRNPDVMNFGQDAEAAVRAATLNLIQDGVIQGLSAAENRLLRQGRELEQAVRDVLDFRSVFDRLKEYKDPVGAAIDRVEDEFDRLRDLFERAGASAEEYADLEELYGLERARAIEEANERVTGALRALLDDLEIGDSGLSLRTRRSNALEDYGALAERVRAGDTSAYDDFADAARALLDIERELFGSTAAYFDRLDEVTELTRSRIDAETNVEPIRDPIDDPGLRTALDSGFGTANLFLENMDRSLAAIRELLTINDSGFNSFPTVRTVKNF